MNFRSLINASGIVGAAAITAFSSQPAMSEVITFDFHGPSVYSLPPISGTVTFDNALVPDELLTGPFVKPTSIYHASFSLANISNVQDDGARTMRLIVDNGTPVGNTNLRFEFGETDGLIFLLPSGWTKLPDFSTLSSSVAIFDRRSLRRLSITQVFPAVPEVETWAMFIAGMAMVGSLTRRRASQTSCPRPIRSLDKEVYGDVVEPVRTTYKEPAAH